MKDFLLQIPLSKCLICGEDRSNIWLKEVRRVGNDKYAVLVKCGKCAWVNTTYPIELEYDDYLPAQEYHLFDHLYTLDGKEHPKTENYPLFGFDFHGVKIKDGEITVTPRNDIRCLKCGSEMKYLYFQEFYRNTIGKQRRIDVFYKCTFCGETIAFGVHVPKAVIE